MSVCMSYLGYS